QARGERSEYPVVAVAVPFLQPIQVELDGGRIQEDHSDTQHWVFCTTGPFQPSLLMGYGRTGPQNGWQTD
ncbi:MAG: hypothetical protein QGF71_08475, partial [Rhodospirillales bacterium]|nr:hypothetical protein [Rhodospirillales bacterium]